MYERKEFCKKLDTAHSLSMDSDLLVDTLDWTSDNVRNTEPNERRDSWIGLWGWCSNTNNCVGGILRIVRNLKF